MESDGRCPAAQFVAFASNATGQTLTLDDFWSNELCMQYYKNLVSFWLNHPNAQMNGLQFKVSGLCNTPIWIWWNPRHALSQLDLLHIMCRLS